MNTKIISEHIKVELAALSIGQAFLHCGDVCVKIRVVTDPGGSPLNAVSLGKGLAIALYESVLVTPLSCLGFEKGGPSDA